MLKFTTTTLLVLAGLTFGHASGAQAGPCDNVYRGSLSDGNILKLTLSSTGGDAMRVRMVINRDPAQYGYGSCRINARGVAHVAFDVDGLNARGFISGAEFRGRTADGLGFDIFRE